MGWGRRLLKITAALLAIGLVVAGIGAAALAWMAAPQVLAWWDEAAREADRHVAMEVSHPGWSFPGKVVTAATPLTLPFEKLLVEARARAYTEDCTDTGPGEFCIKKRVVVPREGGALEPIVLGPLLGPDAELREHLPLREAPQHLIDAIVAAEDRTYWQHRGVDFIAMARAARSNMEEGTYIQGGSTLTMQVVRNLFQRKEKTVFRKLREMVMALSVDHHLGKEAVLQIYLDAPYLGQWGSLSVCGFRAASRHYFGKDAPELTLAEAATLASILPAPARFAPDRFPERARERRDRVLRAMGEHMGYDVAQALSSPVTTVPPTPMPEAYPAWMSATRAWLTSRLPPHVVFGTGLYVTVSMDIFQQETGVRLFESKVPWLQSVVGQRSEKPLEAAAVLIDVSTGAVRALYSGSGITATGFNRATQARRQAGSSYKPLVYALAFNQPRGPDGKPTFTAATAVPNVRRIFDTPQGKWNPRNIGGEYSTTASLAQALTWSQNVATASLLERMGGPQALIELAGRMGFDTRNYPREMGLALGQGEVTPLEMARMTAIIAGGGEYLEAGPVWRAVDLTGREHVAPPARGVRVLSPYAALMTRELMRLVVDVGTGGAARGGGGESGYPGELMGKTGTADSERDLWFIGATPSLAGALWLGYDVPERIGATASDIAAPLFGWWLRRLTQYDGPPPTFPREEWLVRRDVCTVTGLLVNSSCKRIAAPFLRGSAPAKVCGETHPREEVEMDLSDESTSLDDRLTEDPAAPVPKKHYESIWARRAREEAEKAAAPPSP